MNKIQRIMKKMDLIEERIDSVTPYNPLYNFLVKKWNQLQDEKRKEQKRKNA